MGSQHGKPSTRSTLDRNGQRGVVTDAEMDRRIALLVARERANPVVVRRAQPRVHSSHRKTKASRSI